MRYGSVCSGIEAASVAFMPLGWQPVFFAEIDPFCSALLRYHYPTVSNLGNFTTITQEHGDGPVDLLIAGTPCQSFSVAGQRGGLADPRGNLTLEYFALIDRLRPRWLVWENVPGLLSNDNGRTFGTCLGLLAECGYGFAYRVLDAQYAGVPQRRERVFLVGYLGDWRPPAAVLFESHSLSGHPAPRRETGQGIAACLTQGVDSQGKGGYAGRRREDDINLVAFHHKASHHQSMNPSAVAPTLDQSKDVAIAFDTTQITSPDNHCNPQPSDPCHQLTAQGHAPAIAYGGNNMSGPIDMATACNAHGGTARLDVESETFVVYSESGKGWGKEDVQPLRESQSQSPESGRVVIPLQEVNGRKSKNQNGVGIGIADSHSPMYTLQSGQQYGVALAFTERTRTSGRNLETLADTSYALCNPGSGGRAQSRQVLAPTLTRNHGKQPDNTASKEDRMLIHEGMMVRRLTPRECERLQGFPDDYTLVPYRGKPASDSPRYRAIGNSFAVPVVRWIGQRIQQVDTILASLQP